MYFFDELMIWSIAFKSGVRDSTQNLGGEDCSKEHNVSGQGFSKFVTFCIASYNSFFFLIFYSLTDQNADPQLDPKLILAGDSMLNIGANCGGQGVGMMGSPGLDKYQ